MPTLKELQDKVDQDVKNIKTAQTNQIACKQSLAGTNISNYGATQYDESWLAANSTNLYDAQYCTGTNNQKAACQGNIAVVNSKIQGCRSLSIAIDNAKKQLVIDQKALDDFVKTDPASINRRYRNIAIVVVVVIIVVAVSLVYIKKKGVLK